MHAYRIFTRRSFTPRGSVIDLERAARPVRVPGGASAAVGAGQLRDAASTAPSPSTGVSGASAPLRTGWSSGSCGNWPTSCWSGPEPSGGELRRGAHRHRGAGDAGVGVGDAAGRRRSPSCRRAPTSTRRSRLFTDTGWPPIVSRHRRRPGAGPCFADAGARIVTPATAQSPATGCRRPRAISDLRRVLCEGGPSLFGQLTADDAVDEVCLTTAPRARRRNRRSRRHRAGGPDHRDDSRAHPHRHRRHRPHPDGCGRPGRRRNLAGWSPCADRLLLAWFSWCAARAEPDRPTGRTWRSNARAAAANPPRPRPRTADAPRPVCRPKTDLAWRDCTQSIARRPGRWGRGARRV